MPLVRGASQNAITTNIGRLINEGYPRDQAVAALQSGLSVLVLTDCSTIRTAAIAVAAAALAGLKAWAKEVLDKRAA